MLTYDTYPETRALFTLGVIVVALLLHSVAFIAVYEASKDPFSSLRYVKPWVKHSIMLVCSTIICTTAGLFISIIWRYP